MNFGAHVASPSGWCAWVPIVTYAEAMHCANQGQNSLSEVVGFGSPIGLECQSLCRGECDPYNSRVTPFHRRHFFGRDLGEWTFAKASTVQRSRLVY